MLPGLRLGREHCRLALGLPNEVPAPQRQGMCCEGASDKLSHLELSATILRLGETRQLGVYLFNLLCFIRIH